MTKEQEITKAQVMTALKTTAANYENMIGVELTDEDADDVIRAMKNKALSLNDAAKEIVEGILVCLFRTIE
jgi:hypothetical protein